MSIAVGAAAAAAAAFSSPSITANELGDVENTLAAGAGSVGASFLPGVGSATGSATGSAASAAGSAASSSSGSSTTGAFRARGAPRFRGGG